MRRAKRVHVTACLAQFLVEREFGASDDVAFTEGLAARRATVAAALTASPTIKTEGMV